MNTTAFEVSAYFTCNVHKFRVLTTLQIQNATIENDSLFW